MSEDVERIEMFSLLNPQGFGDTFKSTDNTVRALVPMDCSLVT